MISQRLKAIASLVDDDVKVFDVGCDHGLLSIYLSRNHEVVASDINEESILLTKENVINNSSLVNVIQSDGLNKLDISKEDTIIIAGMGTFTILNIINKGISKLSDTLIIQSNKNQDTLRKEMDKLGYYIDKEIDMVDSNYYYSIMKFKKGKKHHNNIYYLLGPNPTKEYINHILLRYTKMFSKIPNRYFIKRIKTKLIIYKLKKQLSK